MINLNKLKQILKQADAEGQSSIDLPILDLNALGAEIESLEQLLSNERRKNFAIKQANQSLREKYEALLALCLDCWFQFAYQNKGNYHDGGLSTLERLFDELREAGLIDEKGRAIK